MPFSPVPDPNQDADVKIQGADVKIFFSGLLILKPIANNLCEVFVHTSAPRHFLTIEVRRKHTDNQPDEVMMRHIGPLAFIRTDQDGQDQIPVHGMEIKKVFGQGAGQSVGVQKFVPNNPQPNDLPAGFNLAINLQGAEFHQGNPVLPSTSTDPEEPTRRLLDIDPLGARPSILLRDGILYTAAKTRPNIVINLQKNGQAIRELPAFASLIGAAIPLEDNTHVALHWRQQGKLETLDLNKENNVKYEIYIVNDPLFENDSIQNVEKDPKHDEFREYYKILPRVPSDQQFRLDVEILENAPPSRGSTRAPCMSISLDDSD